LSGNILIFVFIAALLFILTLLVPKIALIVIITGIGLVSYFLVRKKRQNVILLIAGVAAACIIVFSVDYAFNHILQEHQRTRINVLLGKEIDLKGAGYNVNQSKIAIGSGGFLGKGFLQGTQTKYSFVPEQSTDFIFCTVGEEWGFLGTFVVITLFMLLLGRIIYVAERQRSQFTRIYGYGVASILFFHLMVNVGMTIGLAPVIGIPLPFFSYGGSSLWSFTILLFIFIKLDAYRLQILR
jgi:rod shape determining protein RodA